MKEGYMYKAPEYLYDVREAKPREIKSIDWTFDWQKEFEADRTVYKLMNQEREIVGLISMEDREEYIYVSIIERQQKFKGHGITPYLFSIASLWSNYLGYNSGFMFHSKTHLIEYYQRLGAMRISGQKMILESPHAEILIKRCLPYMNIEHSKL